MIKYVELTAPEASAYRQAKIVSIEKNEGDTVKAGDTLFVVQSGNTKLDLPSTKDGRIVEFIVTEQENITLSTPLLLLETVVEGRTATSPITAQESESNTVPDETKVQDELQQVELKPTSPESTIVDSRTASPSKTHTVETNRSKNSQTVKRHEQQTLDLMAGLEEGSVSKNTEDQAATNNAPPKAKSSVVSAAASQTIENSAMSENNSLTVNVPDIGADSAKVIEILVKVGDEVNAEDSLVILESDKASMDVPSPHSGTVKSISVLVDQDVNEGTPLLELEVSENADSLSTATALVEKSPSAEVEQIPAQNNEPAAQQETPAVQSQTVEVKIPDIGGDSAKVVDILVSEGDEVAVEDALVTLESDKASMDVPSSHAGTVQSIAVKVDDDVSEGSVVVVLSTNQAASSTISAPVASAERQASPAPQPATAAAPTLQAQTPATAPVANATAGESHASPSIRRFARELGVDLTKVVGTGRKKRITKDDVKAFVKGALSQPADASSAPASGAGIPAVPAQDFTKFGDIELQPRNKIKRLTAENLHRSWLNVPHVTHNDESNISDLESFRKQLNAEYAQQKKDIKLSPLAFIVKAVVSALKAYPQFNASLEPGGENLILKKYFNVGIAVDTPNGLVVPVIKEADIKSVAQIAQEMGELAQKARDKKLTMNDMSGACITISSLGGIGGTSFTPIVNAPEVAILGVSRSKTTPVWDGEQFIPGTMLPLSLSYDHRVIDGAEAARFTRHIAAALEDVRRLTL